MSTLGTRAFIGRVDELAALDDALERAASGRTTTVLIGGDAGIGKSSLLAEWNVRARDRGARVAIGVALDLGDHGPPYAAVAQALRDLLSGLDPAELDMLLGPERSVLARVIPELAADPGRETAGGRPQGSWQLGQFRLFDRFRDILTRAGEDTPLVLELEDLHWADPSTRAFLVYLVENITAGRLLTIGTYRTEDVASGTGFGITIGQLRRRPAVELLALKPFTELEVYDQLAAVLGHQPTTALLEAIVSRSEGNALLVEELADAKDPSTSLPASVADATAVRVATLTQAARAVLRAAAVIGSTVDDGLLRAVARMDDLELDQALREIVAARLLVAEPATNSYRFRHALIHDAIYEDTLPGERRRLHAAVASALLGGRDDAALDGAQAAIVARHWFEGRELERAFQASLVAAAATAEQAAYEESLGHYERALELWDLVPEQRGSIARSTVLTGASSSASLAGDFPRSLRYAQAAVANIGDAPDPSLQLNTLLQLERATFGVGGDWFEIAAMVGQLDETGRPPGERIRILEDRAYALGETNWSAAVDLARKVQELSNTEDDPNLIARAEALLGDLLWMRDPAASEVLLRHALELAIDTGDVTMENEIRRSLGETLQIAHMYEAMIENADLGIEFAERRHVGRMARPRFCAHKAWAELRLGRLAAARAAIARGLADEPIGYPLVMLHLVGVQAATAMGDYPAATRHVEGARSPDAPDDLEAQRAYFSTVRAELALAERRHADARRFVEAGLSHLAEEGPEGDELETAWWLAELGLAVAAEEAEIARAGGDAAAEVAARSFSEKMVDLLDRVRRFQDEEGIPDIGTVTGYELLMAGHQARLEGRDDPSLWAAAADAFRPTSIEALGARVRQAEAMLGLRMARAEAQTVLAAAHGTSVEIGARPLADRIATLARRARIELRTPGDVEEPPSDEAAAASATEGGAAAADALRSRGLSNREIEVLTLVASGYSNKEIGERLFISDKTASVHVTHILDKLGVSTRTEAATVGVRLGIPEVDAADAGR